MRYGMFSMRTASASRGSVSCSGDSCRHQLVFYMCPALSILGGTAGGPRGDSPVGKRSEIIRKLRL